MSEYPAQLPGESDKAYAHFRAWVDFEDRETRGATTAFAQRRDIKPDQVRRLRSKYDWNARAATVPTMAAAIHQRTTELVVEQTAQSLAEKIVAARERNAAAHAGLVAKIGKKVNEALELLDLTSMDNAQLGQFILRGAREMAPPREATTNTTVAVQHNTHLDLQEVHTLPPAQQARRVREMVAEADRQAALLDQYYSGQGAQ